VDNNDFDELVGEGEDGELEYEENEDPIMYYSNNIGRIFYDGLYNMIIVIVLSAVVSGIIIDTFGALRDQENEKVKDIRDKCFICGI
jgi:hypothetical protein